MVNVENDYKYGEEKEKAIKVILEKKFGELKSGDRYSKYDFENDNLCIEVKSRRNKHNQYPTTLFALNKIIDTNKTILCIFNFIDKIMYIKYNKEKFDRYEKKKINYIDTKTYYFIPISDLTELN
jgi:hypothetical protein